MKHWSFDSIFYHIYPLGLCGAPAHNDFQTPAVPRLDKLYGWLDHLQDLGVNALYLGPLFESTVHGYDTADYYRVDRRLGDNTTLRKLSEELHRRGIRLVLDGVFNHVGRDFWAFQDVRQYQGGSKYCDWFQGLDFQQRSPFNDPFTYDSWNGYYELVKLNLHTPGVRDHLFQAIKMWIDEFEIDGLRLDVADSLDHEFMKALRGFTKGLHPDFWLMGEVIHGDYRRWANTEMLDSVTNYEAYKGLYSSLNDKNYFEIAYALNRQFGEGGLYQDLPLYAFADNHDVNRVASELNNPAHLFPLYCLLFTMPGTPSIYYGSEWGITGRRNDGSDCDLRPELDLGHVSQESPHRDLKNILARLARLRRSLPTLTYGRYRQLHVSPEQFAFIRSWDGVETLVILNASDQTVELELYLPHFNDRILYDQLNPGDSFQIKNGKLSLPVPPYWSRILS